MPPQMPTQPSATKAPQQKSVGSTPLDILTATPEKLVKLFSLLDNAQKVAELIEIREELNKASNLDKLKLRVDALEIIQAIKSIADGVPEEHRAKREVSATVSLNPHSILTTREATDTKAGICHWSDFTNQILSLIKNQDTQIQIPTFFSYDLTISTTVQAILDKEKQSGKKEEDILWTPEELSYFINNQSEIKDKDTNVPNVTTPLKIDGNANIFLMKNNKGDIVAVRANWGSDDREWDLGAGDLSSRWLAGSQVVSRNK